MLAIRQTYDGTVRVLICAHRSWSVRLVQQLRDEGGHRYAHIGRPEDLTVDRLRSLHPDIAFFPDWSWKVPIEILRSVKCFGFHAAPLPGSRGGSPIQNQIAAGIERTTLTAFLMSEELDAGDILLESPLSLGGSLDAIFGRMRRSIKAMIRKILAGDYKARRQSGPARVMPRRAPAMSELKDLDAPLPRIYDHIRMLADPYPNAFIRLGGKKIVFKRARFDGEKIAIEGEIRSES